MSRKIAEDAFLEPEPEDGSKIEGLQLSLIYNRYTYLYSYKEAKKFILEYASSKQDEELYDAVKNDTKSVSITFGWISRLLTKGCDIPEESLIFYDKKRKEAIERARTVPISFIQDIPEAEEIVERPKIKPKVTNIISLIEEEVDNLIKGNDEFDAKIFLEKYKLTGKDLEKISHHYTPCLKELTVDYLEKRDPQLVEAYSRYSKKHINRMIEFYQKITQACAFRNIERLSERKPRKIRKKSTDKLIEKMRYLPKDDELGIVSFNPSKIIGAKLVWIFNTKTRELAYYKSDVGLIVRGTTIENVSKSEMKTVRKPKDFLKMFMETTPTRRIKLLENIRAVTKEGSARMNPSCLLLVYA